MTLPLLGPFWQLLGAVSKIDARCWAQAASRSTGSRLQKPGFSREAPTELDAVELRDGPVPFEVRREVREPGQSAPKPGAGAHAQPSPPRSARSWHRRAPEANARGFRAALESFWQGAKISLSWCTPALRSAASRISIWSLELALDPLKKS